MSSYVYLGDHQIFLLTGGLICLPDWWPDWSAWVMTRCVCSDDGQMCLPGWWSVLSSWVMARCVYLGDGQFYLPEWWPDVSTCVIARCIRLGDVQMRLPGWWPNISTWVMVRCVYLGDGQPADYGVPLQLCKNPDKRQYAQSNNQTWTCTVITIGLLVVQYYQPAIQLGTRRFFSSCIFLYSGNVNEVTAHIHLLWRFSQNYIIPSSCILTT